MISEWVRIEPVHCDLCGKTARWRHPAGGLRCLECPRPIVSRYGIFDHVQRRWWPRSFNTFAEAKDHYDRCKGVGSDAEVREYPHEP